MDCCTVALNNETSAEVDAWESVPLVLFLIRESFWLSSQNPMLQGLHMPSEILRLVLQLRMGPLPHSFSNADGESSFPSCSTLMLCSKNWAQIPLQLTVTEVWSTCISAGVLAVS